MLVKRALKDAENEIFQFPNTFDYLENTVLIMPVEVDDLTRKLASKFSELLGKKIRAVLSHSLSQPIECDRLIIIPNEARGIFGYPKKSYAKKLDEFSASIDLSPEFDLSISTLPVWAKIPLRIGRDENRAGDAYNIIISGDGVSALASMALKKEKNNI